MDLNIRVSEDPETDATTISFGFGNCVGYITYQSEVELSAVREMLAAVCEAQWAEDYAEMTADTETSGASVY